MKRKILVAAGIMVISLVIVSVAYAFTLGNVDGTWGDIDGVTAGPGTQDVIGGATVSGGTVTLYPPRTDQTMVRLSSVCRGDPDGSTTYDGWTRTTGTPSWNGLGSYTGCAATTGLFFSEYLYDQASGGGTCSSTSTTDNDCDLLGIEIYNRTGSAVNLANYSLRLFTGGRASYTTIALSGTLANNDVYVVVNYRASGSTDQEDQVIENNNSYRAIALFNENETAGARCNRWATGNGNTPTSISSGDKGVQTGSITDENQVRYGRHAYYTTSWQSLSCDLTNFAQQSGFGFDGNNGPLNPSPDTPFYLGKFTHYNNQVFSTDDNYANANAFTFVDLTIKMPITCETGDPTPPTVNVSFDSHFVLDETSNSIPCTYPGTSICPDKVTVTQPSSQTFTCPEGDYTVNILGFQPQNASDPDCSDAWTGTSQTEYITEEDQNNVACLWAEITAPTADISPDKTCANYNLQDPYYTIVVTNAGPGSARQVQFTDTFATGVVLGTPLVYTSQLTTSGGTVNVGSCSKSGQTVTCQLLTSLPPTSVDPNAKWTVVIHVANIENSPSLTFPVSNTVSASTATTDTNPANNSDTCSSTTPTSSQVSQPSAVGGYETITVNWYTDDGSDIHHFELYRSIDPDDTKILLGTFNNTYTPGFSSYEYVDADVQPGIVYKYWLKVFVRGGSFWMDPASAFLEVIRNENIFLPAILK